MSGFELHGIKHTSASQINKWMNDQSAWIVEKLYKFRFPYGYAAERGIKVENAVVNTLTGN